jgi:putative hydrolase of the HAD superfamily
LVEAVIFDIGGVLEVTPPTGWQERWATRLGLETSELGLDEVAIASFMGDLWTEYLGTLNIELARYFAALRPRFSHRSPQQQLRGGASASRSYTGSGSCVTSSSTRTRGAPEARPPPLPRRL